MKVQTHSLIIALNLIHKTHLLIYFLSIKMVRYSHQQELDYESQTEHIFKVIATDQGGNGALIGSALVRVIVSDTNDNNPRWIVNTYQAIIREDARLGTKVAFLQGTDDDTIQSQLQYRIIGGNTNTAFGVVNNEVIIQKFIGF